MAVWDRRDDENEETWAAFKAYRDQAPPRALKKAAGVVCKPLTEILALSQDNAWKERVAAYDAHMDAVVQAEREEFLKQDVRTRTAAHLALLHDAREMAANEMRKLLAWSERADNATVIQPQQLAKFLEIVVKLERLVSGESTENTNATLDLSGLSVEDLKTVQGILAKASQNVATPALTASSRSSKPS